MFLILKKAVQTWSAINIVRQVCVVKRRFESETWTKISDSESFGEDSNQSDSNSSRLSKVDDFDRLTQKMKNKQMLKRTYYIHLKNSLFKLTYIYLKVPIKHWKAPC